MYAKSYENFLKFPKRYRMNYLSFNSFTHSPPSYPREFHAAIRRAVSLEAGEPCSAHGTAGERHMTMKKRAYTVPDEEFGGAHFD